MFRIVQTVVICCATTASLAAPSKTPSKGNQYLAKGHTHEANGECDVAVVSYEKAVASDPAHIIYQLASSDFSISLPGALFQAALSDSDTKVRQSPQIRAIDNTKATLKIGGRRPTASGSYSAGTGAMNLLGGLTQDQDSKSFVGIPGL